MTQVKNINGITMPNCKCGCWLTHLKKHNRKPVVFCAEIRCTQMFELEGALVQNTEQNDEQWYVIALCDKHRVATDELTIVNMDLIPAMEEPNCDK